MPRSQERYTSVAAREAPDRYDALASGLGWFSVGLGLAEMAAPGALARFIGIKDEKKLRSPLFGMREFAAGVGLLSGQRRDAWLWSRVAGDVVDLSTLIGALQSDNANRTRVIAAMAAVAGVTALDVFCASKLSNGTARSGYRPETTKTVTINRSPEDLYQFWRDFRNLPQFMQHLESVEEIGHRRSRWRMTGPLDTKFEWESELTHDEPNRRIAWQSAENADIYHSGEVRFEPATGDRGTVVTVKLEYEPPGGAIGNSVAKLFGKEPGQIIDSTLRHFKQIMETGEIVHSDASIHAWMHAAQPAEV